MLESLDYHDGSQAARDHICEAFNTALQKLISTDDYQERSIVYKAEKAVSADPENAFRFDEQGYATLDAWKAGKFECASLASLRTEPHGGGARARLWLLEGTSPVTDIGALQALAPEGSLFQVASQFNCLEAPSSRIVPVSDYFFDPTQGPRASISAFPATLLRHYQAPAPGGGRLTQREPGPQLNLLHKVARDEVQSGYLQPANIPDPPALAKRLEDQFDELEVGFHQGAQVVLGANWDGPVEGERLIAQVFTSTLACGGYGRVDFENPTWLSICQSLQRAAYLGTLMAAAKSGQKRAVLTLIGGGVFGNPLSLIWDAIVWACKEVEPMLRQDLTVVVNGRTLRSGVDVKNAHSVCEGVLLCSGSGTRFLEA